MIALVSQVGGTVMLFGILLMLLPVIRRAPWGYVPMFEAALVLFLAGLLITLAGALGWIISGAFGFSLTRYPLTGA